jgi:hypothetical protein
MKKITLNAPFYLFLDALPKTFYENNISKKILMGSRPES